MSKKRANGDGGIYYDSQKGIYRGQITIGYDEEGKQKRKTVSGKNLNEVKQKMKQIEYGIFSGEFVDKSNITIYHLAKQIIDDKLNMNEIKESTYYANLGTLKSLREIYNTPLQSANETQIRAYLQKRIEKSNSIIRKEYELLNRTFKEAVSREIITKNPMDHIRLPRSKKKNAEVRALTVDEQRKLIDVLMTEDVMYSNQILLSMFTGMRMGEINALTKKDINLSFNVISVNKTLSRGEKGRAIISDTAKTYAGSRPIIMTDDVRQIITECLESAEGDLLFTDKNGGLITTCQVNLGFLRTLKKYDIIDENVEGKVTCHSLRHTYATRMIEGGMQPKVLQKLLGHTDIRITLNTYCNAFENFQNDNIALASAYLRENGLSITKKNDTREGVENQVKIS